MESNGFKGIKNDFLYLLNMALQNRMSWNVLAFNFNSLAPSLNETREIISILLKELEALHITLQKKDKLLEEYQNESKSVAGNELTKEYDSVSLVDVETIGLDDNEQNDFSEESETIEDDTEVLGVVKENVNQELYFELNEGAKASEVFEINMHVNENDLNQKDESKSLKEIDNKCYTFVANDKNCDSGIYLTLENKEIVVELTKKRPYQCTICQKAFQNSNNLESHIKIHTGEVPFECKTCSKRFRTKYALKKHERIHI